MIGVVVPCHDTIHGDTVTCLTHLFAKHEYGSLRFYNPRGASVQQNRYFGAQAALRDQCSHILFIDADMVFPADALDRLSHWGYPMVACSYPKRDGSGEIVGMPIERPYHNECPIWEHSAGMGMALIDRQVFNAILSHRWFNIRLDPVVGWETEDESFYNEARNHGYLLRIDKELSLEIGHLGVRKHFLRRP